MKLVSDARRAINGYPFFEEPSDWKSGVCQHAHELFDKLLEHREVNDSNIYIGRITEIELLDGAKNWYSYSFEGKALKSSNDIRERLSPTTSTKAHDNEFWFSVQAEALRRAAQVVAYAVNNHLPGEKWKKGCGKVKKFKSKGVESNG